MKRKFNLSDDQQPNNNNHSSSSSSSSHQPPSKQVKFDTNTPSSSSSNQHSDNDNNSTSKFTLESIREAKFLKKIQQIEGFEHTTSILGQMTSGDQIEGEEGDLNQERFQEEAHDVGTNTNTTNTTNQQTTVFEHFHLGRERNEGIFKEKSKIKKNKNHRVLKKVINEEDDFSSSDNDDENSDGEGTNKEKDDWADNLEEMTVKITKKGNEILPNKEIPSMEDCYTIIVNTLSDKKEKISSALERLKKNSNSENSEYSQLIKIINILISYYNQYDIYDKKREFFQKQVKWYYKAKNDDEPLKIHGPFTTSEILDWSEQYLNDDTVEGIRNNLEVNFNLFSSYDFNKFN